MEITLLYSSTVEPATLSEAKTFLAVDHDEHDSLISALIQAARERAEEYCNRSFVEKKYRLSLDTWPPRIPSTMHASLRLPRGPVAEVVHVKYKNGETVETLAESKYTFSSTQLPTILHFIDDLPPVPMAHNAVEIEYITGKYSNTPDTEGDEIIPFPEPVSTAIKMLTRTMYDHRDDMVIGAAVSQLPQSAEYLLKNYRVFLFQ